MSFFKRATTSILRRPSKTIILLLLIFILGTVISGAISVNGAVNNTDANLRRGMRPVVSFASDQEAMAAYYEETGEWARWQPLTIESIHEMAALPYVNQVNYSVRAMVPTNALQDYWPGMRDGNFHFSSDNHQIHLSLHGTSNALPVPFAEGMLEVIEGQTFTDEQLQGIGETYPVLISDGFAYVNDLSVGSIVDVNIDIFRWQEADIVGGEWDPEWQNNEENILVSRIFPLEVIGIFDAVGVGEDGGEADLSEEDHMLLERRRSLLRNFYTTNEAAIAISNFHAEGMRLVLEEVVNSPLIDLESEEFSWIRNQLEDDTMQPSVDAVMELDDVSDLEAFRAAVEPMLPDFWMVSDLSNSFDDISSSMGVLQGIARWVLIGSVATTLLILSLLITLFLRDRRYEMGVYLALGEKKGKIVMQILLEVVATAVIGITLAVFTGNLISGAMSQTMLRNELVNEGNQDFDMGWCIGCDPLEDMGFTQTMSPEDMLEAFDVSIDIQTVGVFYAVGLGAVIFSTIVPVIYVVTLNPKKVLM